MAVIGSLTVKLGLVTVEWDKATAKAKQEAKDLQSAFAKLGVDMNNLKQLFANLGGAAGLSVAGLAAMSAAIFDMAGKMQDLADATGVSAGKILQFQNALMLAGGKAEDAQTIIGTLFSKIAAAQDGNDTAIAQFEQLGISFAELKRLSPDEAIKRVYEGLSQVGNSYEKVKNIKELLGKAGLGKSVDDIAKALQGSTKEFDRQAESLKKWDAMGDSLTQTMFNLKIAIAELLAPFTTQKVATVDQFKAAIIAIGSAVVVGQIFNLVAAFKAFNTALKGTISLSVALQTLKGGKGLAMGAAAIAAYATAMSQLGGDEEETRQTVEGKVEPYKPEEKQEELGGKEGGNQAAMMREKLNQAKEQLRYDLLRLDLQRAMLSGSQHQLKVAESIAQKEEEQSRAKTDRAQALAKENLTAEQRGLIEEEYKFKMHRANEMHQARVDLLNAQRDKAKELGYLEIDQAKARNIQTEKSLNLELQRRETTEGEYARNRAQLQMEQKVMEIQQERQRFELENKDINKESWEYKQAIAKFAEREKAVMTDYNTQVKIINQEEQIRLELLRKELDFMVKRNDLIIQAAQLENNARNMTEFDVRRAQQGIDLTMRLRDIEQQRETLRINRKDTNSEEYQAEVQRLNNMENLARQEAKIRLEGIALDEQEAMSWSAGWEAALRDFGKNVQRYGDVARNMFDSVVGNMNSAIDNFVRTGKLSFKDLAKSIIQDLIAIQLKAQAAFLLNAALKGMGFAGFTAKAGGGAVSQSIPYMVGENGPELFVPQAGGAIIPTQRLGGDMGMGGQVINYNGPYIQNMSAIDTQTASQFLAKNRMAVWSANQSATRSLPQSR
jgi:lambda family phage tail tape measure protein